MKRFFKQGWAALVLALAFVVIAGVSVKAAGATSLTLFYADNNKASLKEIFDDGEKQEEIGGTMMVAAKGGIFGDGAVFSFSSDINDQLNNAGDGADDDSDEYFAVTQVYCSNNKLSLTTPKTRPYFKIDYTLGYKFGKWDDVQNGDNYPTRAGITKIVKVGSSGATDTTVHIKDDNTGYGNLWDNDNNGSTLGGGDASGKDINKILPKACNDGLPRKSMSVATRNYYKLSADQKKEIDDIIASKAPSVGGPGGDGDIPCIGGAMGWVLCPIINYMADGVVALSNIIDSMMQFKLLINADSSTGIRETLNNFVGIANIILVIAFLIIIFSQSTSLGLSNYNIKKMLPKVVIAAILINLSFYICAFAVDISNIVGNSIMGLVSGQGVAGATVGEGIKTATQLSGPGSVQKVFGAVMLSVIGVILLIMFLGPLLLGIFITFVVLVARQVILLFLIVTAPIAFAAWLLPNTETWFKKWKDLFVNMLMVYPIVMLVFGLAIFAAKFMSDPSIQNSNTGLATGAAIGPLIPLVVLAIPLLALPFIIKSSGSMLGRISAYADKFGKQSGGRINAGMKRMPGTRSVYEGVDQWKGAREAGFQKGKAGRAVGRAGRLGRVLPGKDARQILAASAASQEDKQFKEAVEMHKAQMIDMGPDQLKEEFKKAVSSGNHEVVRATMDRMAGMGVGGANALSDAVHEASPVSEEMATTIQRGINDGSNYGSLVGKAADLTKGGFKDIEGGGKAWGSGSVADVSAQQLAGQSGDAMMRSAGISVSKAADGKTDVFTAKDGKTISQDEAIQEAAKHLQEGAGAKVSAISGNSELEALVADDNAGAILQRAARLAGGNSGPSQGGSPPPAQGGSSTQGGTPPVGGNWEESESGLIIPRERK